MPVQEETYPSVMVIKSHNANLVIKEASVNDFNVFDRGIIKVVNCYFISSYL